MRVATIVWSAALSDLARPSSAWITRSYADLRLGDASSGRARRREERQLARKIWTIERRAATMLLMIGIGTPVFRCCLRRRLKAGWQMAPARESLLLCFLQRAQAARQKIS